MELFIPTLLVVAVIVLRPTAAAAVAVKVTDLLLLHDVNGVIEEAFIPDGTTILIVTLFDIFTLQILTFCI